MPKLSVIVPVYNVERYLSICLDSIRSQSFPDFEIVCVDDGSRDRSRAILDLYAQVDDRIKIVDKPNGGLSSARNAGIRAADGDYVCFVDSDDFLQPKALARIAEVFDATHADVVTFGGVIYPSHHFDPWLEGVLSPRDAEYDEFDPRLLAEEAAEPFAWRTACRRAFLLESGVLFDEEMRYGEDKLFHYAVYPRSKKTVFISDKLYAYRVGRAGSLMDGRSDNPVLRIYDHIRIVEKICADWHEGGFIDRFGSELLGLTADFVLVDVLMSPYEVRNILCNYLEAVWSTYFPASQLERLARGGKYGSMATAILFDRTKAYGMGRRFSFYRHTLRTRPGDFIRRPWGKLKGIRPIRRVIDGVRDALPMSSRRQREMALDLNWKVMDGTMLSDSLDLVKIEAERRSGN